MNIETKPTIGKVYVDNENYSFATLMICLCYKGAGVQFLRIGGSKGYEEDQDGVINFGQIPMLFIPGKKTIMKLID